MENVRACKRKASGFGASEKDTEDVSIVSGFCTLMITFFRLSFLESTGTTVHVESYT